MNQAETDAIHDIETEVLDEPLAPAADEAANSDADDITELKLLHTMAEAVGRTVIADIDEVPPEFQVSLEPAIIAICKQHGAVAVSDDGMVLLATPNAEAINFIRHRIRRLLPENAQIQILPATRYVVNSLTLQAEAALETENTHSIRKKSSERSAAQRNLDALIENAVTAEASDIHLLCSDESAKILYRVRRRIVLKESNVPTARVMHMMRSAINYDAILGAGQATKTFDPTVPNDASFDINFGKDQSIQIRLASIPTKNGGCAIVMRLLGANIGKTPTLKRLGYLPEQQLMFEQSAAMPFGAIIVSGPTGSGKSTTLRAAMNLIPSDKRVYTFEDPIEGDINFASQCPINEENPDTTAVNLAKTSLRLDPDVLMYGELREAEMVKIFTRASTTGHLVFTTLHTNSAVDIIPALSEMGIFSQRLADPTFLRILGAQRLVPGLCPNCRLPASEHLGESLQDRRLREHFGAQLDSVYIANPEGCSTCDGTGAKGDRLIAEVINVDPQDRRYIADGDMTAWLAHLKTKGWRDMKDHAELLVLAGELCVRTADTQLTSGFGIDAANDAFDYHALRKYAESLEQ